MTLLTRRTLPAVVIALAIGGCAERSDEPSAETIEARQMAYSQACVGRELAIRAADDIATIEEMAANSDPNDAMGALNLRASGAALEFARAYQRQAELREAAYAQIDSALNHAVTPEDSARFIRRAESFTVRLPESGSVEANVFDSYQQNYATLMSDEDHPCNWDFPF